MRGEGHLPSAVGRSAEAQAGLTVRPRLVTRKRTAYVAERDRPDLSRRRRAWFESQPDLDPNRLVSIDEAQASTAMIGHPEAKGCEPPFRTAIG